MVWQWSQQKYPNVHPRLVLPDDQIGSKGLPPHVHPFPELLSFFGRTRSTRKELRGEIEFWVEDEKYVFTKELCPLHPR
jgi:hypothetical protein